jgi:hypothetical protein
MQLLEIWDTFGIHFGYKPRKEKAPHLVIAGEGLF